jgi:hypothetical protein
MNEKIASIVKGKIDTLPWIDKIAGLVRPIRVEVPGSNNGKVLKTYPIATDVTREDCISGKYKDLIPNSAFSSIVYFEDNGSSLAYRNGDRIGFNSKLTLVGWLNLKKIADCCQYTSSTECILSILAQIPLTPFSDGIYREIRVTAISELIKSNAIFGKYSYDEIKSQYLLYPFDYFALSIQCEFWVNVKCIDDFKMNPCPIC